MKLPPNTADESTGREDEHMKANVGGLDRGVRILIGLVLLALGLDHVVTGRMAIVAYALGAIALVTGVARFCPAWSIFGISTGGASTSQGK